MNENIQTNFQEEEEDMINLQDLWSLFLPKWYWFVLSTFFTVALAVLYLLITPSIYTRSASILIKDDQKSGGMGAAMNEFADMGLFNTSTNINNELLTIQSPTLMTEVVSRLGLNERYYFKQNLKTVELYKNAPVQVIFTHPEDRGVSFYVQMISEKSFVLEDFHIGEDVYEKSIRVNAGDSVQTPAGTLAIVATPHFDKKYIGKHIQYSKASLARTADSYLTNLQASLGNKQATIINLSIKDASTEKAEDILNTLIKVYNEKWILDKNQIAVSTSQFIGERLHVIEKELGHVDENISSYKSAHLLPDVQAASQLYLTQSAANKKELQTLNDQLSTAQYIRQQLNRQSVDQTLSTNASINNSSISSQITEYNSLVINRNRLLTNSSEKNPLVKDLTAALGSLKKTIISSVEDLIVSINTQIQGVSRQESVTTSQLASNPNQAKYLLSVERQQKVKEQLYLYLLQKREENELSQAFTAYNTRVITAPRGNDIPASPKKMLILLAAFILGLCIPAGLIFMKEMMNTTIRGRKDLEKLTVPLIGEIPLNYLKKKERKDVSKSLVVESGSRNVINEAFRVLRTNIDFMTGSNSQVMMLTSFNPGSGKSFVALNLAVSFAIKGKKFLLIDGDLRHGSTSAMVHSPKPGLSDYLSGHITDIQKAMVTHEKYANLQILPIGTVPPNPTELLELPKMAALIEELKDQYDYILIDCPPIDMMADAQIISKLVDRTLFVVRAGLLEKSMLPELQRIYQEKRFPNISMILNGTESAHGRYGYRYGYGYHYGSSYYGSKA